MGIELKGWYLLAREGEPSFRYRVTPSACSPFDLVAVIPWHLKNVLSGVPVVYEPYIERARYVAEYRNYWWQHVRGAKGDVTIKPPVGEVRPYPPPKVEINDSATRDTGGNFGRIARIRIMDDYVESMLAKRISGIEARHWVQFFRMYAEAADPQVISQRLATEFARISPSISAHAAVRLADVVRELCELLK